MKVRRDILDLCPALEMAILPFWENRNPAMRIGASTVGPAKEAALVDCSVIESLRRSKQSPQRASFSLKERISRRFTPASPDVGWPTMGYLRKTSRSPMWRVNATTAARTGIGGDPVGLRIGQRSKRDRDASRANRFTALCCDPLGWTYCVL